MKVDPVAHRVVVSLYLANGGVKEIVEVGAGEVVQIATGACHEVEVEGDRVSFT